MKKTHNNILIILAVITSSVLGGELSFYIAGGISLLGGDVGTSGAWGLSIFLQFLYTSLVIIGFVAFMFSGRKYKKLTPKLLPSLICGTVISTSINFYIIHFHGEMTIPFISLSLIIIVVSLIGNTILTLIFNSLVSSSILTSLHKNKPNTKKTTKSLF